LWPLPTLTHARSLLGKREAWNVPTTWLLMRTVAPTPPQWPAVTKPRVEPRVTEKPTEQ
jgi:hypothetical protein